MLISVLKNYLEKTKKSIENSSFYADLKSGQKVGKMFINKYGHYQVMKNQCTLMYNVYSDTAGR